LTCLKKLLVEIDSLEVGKTNTSAMATRHRGYGLH